MADSAKVNTEDWARQAYCRRHGPLDWVETQEGTRFMTDREWGDLISGLFFPERGQNYEVVDHIAEICGQCPVQAECLQYSLDLVEEIGPFQTPSGYWGGKSQRQRIALYEDRVRSRRLSA